MMDPAIRGSAIVRAARALLEQAALVDLDEEATRDALAAMQSVSAVLGPPTRERLHRRPFDAVEVARREDQPWNPTGFNPVYAQPIMRFHGDDVTADWTSTAFDEGPINSVHGGISAFLIDVVAGVMIQALGICAVTAQLDLTYRRRIPIGAQVQITARLAEIDGRKHTVAAEILLDGAVAVSARGLFIAVDA